ncbi:MAG: thioesterase family protein [Planctomycetota bacterium]
MAETAMETVVRVRVRYAECDPMNVAHHSVYPVWLELARTELLREQGAAYKDLEASGVLFVVARMSLRYHRPAVYDDELEVWVLAEPVVGAKIEHRYEVRRRGSAEDASSVDVLATGQTTLVCVDRAGKMQRVPAGLLP